MKRLLVLILLLSNSVFAESIELKVETIDPLSVCTNTKHLVKLLKPYVDVQLLRCEENLISTGFMGTKTYDVFLTIDSNVEECSSNENQAIVFDIPTDIYPHWNPPKRFPYVDHIISKLGFETYIAVSNIGPISKPKYKQIVLIPECSFRK